MQDLVRSLPSWIQADVCGTLALYSENDAGFSWAQRTAFAGFVKEWNKRTRAMPQDGVTRTAANWLLAWNSDIPFAFGEGHASHKAAIQSVVDDATQGGIIWLTQGTDGNPNGASYNASTGAFANGDGAHLDTTDKIRMVLRGVEPLARGLAARGRGTAPPAGIMTRGGPRVMSIAWEGATVTGNAATPSLLVTVQHDAGTDLRMPLLASTGLGWVLLDGGIPGTSALIKETSCVRVSATTLRVVLASAPTSALSACRAYHVYDDGSSPDCGRLGHGNAVTDNDSDRTACPLVAGYDLDTDLGAQFRADRPLAATMLGVGLS